MVDLYYLFDKAHLLLYYKLILCIIWCILYSTIYDMISGLCEQLFYCKLSKIFIWILGHDKNIFWALSALLFCNGLWAFQDVR